MTAPVNVGRMNHVALPTADPERGARFYCEVLGFVKTPRPSFDFRGSWLLRPGAGVMVHLLHDAAFVPRTDGETYTRGNHVAFQVDDYDAAVAKLRERRIAVTEVVLPDYGYRQAFFRDPDGNVIELGEWPSPEEMFPHIEQSEP